MTASKKKVRRVVRFRILFLFSSFSLLQQGPGKGDNPKRILPREGTRLRASLLIRGSKAGPSEGFNSHLRARGLHTHYWSEVRRPAPRKGSTTASGYSGSAPTTDQGFEGWPLRRVRQPPQSTRAPRPLLVRGSKAGPSEGFDSRPRARRVRDDYGYVCYMAKARATLPRYPRTFPRPAGTIL